MKCVIYSYIVFFIAYFPIMFLRRLIYLNILLHHNVLCDSALAFEPLTIVNRSYSQLAHQAEKHKDQIIQFLNKNNIQLEYKKLYAILLEKLQEDTRNANRRQEYTISKFIKGSRNGTAGITRRIVAGQNTSIAYVPWQASIREKNFPICGGSVVTDRWIVTAAHCLVRARSSDLSVRLGSSWKTKGGQMFDVESSFVHPKYASKTKVNDVGIVSLYATLRFTSNILPIKIVARETKIKAGHHSIVSGWGRLKEGGDSANFLQATSIDMIAMKLCRMSGLDRKVIEPKSMFCAGSFSQDSPDACQGDSGGPIVSDGVLIGVVSWGLGCARGNFPGIYTRLASPILWDWIYEHITDMYHKTRTNST